jgi:hypothetical protein
VPGLKEKEKARVKNPCYKNPTAPTAPGAPGLNRFNVKRALGRDETFDTVGSRHDPEMKSWQK